MALDSYTALKAAVADRVNRTDLTSQIIDAVALCEAQMKRRLTKAGLVGSMQRSTAAVDSEYIATPLDMGVPLTMRITNGTEVRPVENATSQTIDKLRAERNESAAAPRYYTVVGSEFRFYPTPDVSYTAEFDYQKGLAVLSVTNASNWVLASHPDAYLYGSCAQIADLIDDSRLGQWGALFVAAIDDIIESERAKRGSRQALLRSDVPTRRSIFNITTGL